jgi:hypothetical protein
MERGSQGAITAETILRGAPYMGHGNEAPSTLDGTMPPYDILPAILGALFILTTGG